MITPARHRATVDRAGGHTSLLGGAALALLTGAAGLLLPLVAGKLTADLSEDRAITGTLALMTALVLANAALGGPGSYVLRRTAESVVLGRCRRTCCG